MYFCQSPVTNDARSSAIFGNGEPPRRGRYRLGERLSQRGPVEWFAATDLESSRSVRIGREPADRAGAAWPSLTWESEVRSRIDHPGFPRVLDRFVAGDHSHLVLEDPPGAILWDAWEVPEVGTAERFGWLSQLAEILDALHSSAAIVESLQPDQVRVTPLGRVVLSADAAFVPFPVVASAYVHPTCASAPELHRGDPLDARTDLYHFGSVVCALHLSRELTDLDFVSPGDPVPLLAREPDIHPLLGWLIAKTFCSDRDYRFPSEDSGDDLSGFGELRRTLLQAGRELGRVRLEIAAWSSTGMVRGNNEDALSIFQSSNFSDDRTDDWAVIALADGMGGSAAGEVAAALAVQSIRQSLLAVVPQQSSPEGAAPAERGEIAPAIAKALGEANRAVHAAARGDDRHGMGCTAEAIFIDGQQVVIGHVGDSRTYLFHRGELGQLTRDQTYMARLLASDLITRGEARVHPRRSELTQAIGGRTTIVPEMIRAPIVRGDWLIVCSDGLNMRLSAATIRSIVEPAPSADSAARRLINRANRDGANDNVTVVVIRAH